MSEENKNNVGKENTHKSNETPAYANEIKCFPVLVCAFDSSDRGSFRPVLKDCPIEWDESMGYVRELCEVKDYVEIPVPERMAQHIENRGREQYKRDLERYLSSVAHRSYNRKLVYGVNYLSKGSSLSLQISVVVDLDVEGLIKKLDRSVSTGKSVVELSGKELHLVKDGRVAVKLCGAYCGGRKVTGYTLTEADGGSQLELSFEGSQTASYPYVSTSAAGHFLPMGTPSGHNPFTMPL